MEMAGEQAQFTEAVNRLQAENAVFSGFMEVQCQFCLAWVPILRHFMTGRTRRGTVYGMLPGGVSRKVNDKR